jgi:hypothetical protein
LIWRKQLSLFRSFTFSLFKRRKGSPTNHFRRSVRYFGDHQPDFIMRFRLPVLLFVALTACESTTVSTDEAQFNSDPTVSPIQPGLVDEASGLVDSQSQPGHVWVQQDSGNPAELALLGHDGKLKGKIAIPYSTNRDWEDLASGPGPQSGVNYLYIGEIGDNNGQHATVSVYRLPEPASLSANIGLVEKITFTYPDGPRDAEALICDPQTRDLWVVTKREQKVRLYRLKYPQSTTAVIAAEAFGELPAAYSLTTGGGISPDGTEILLRTYLGVFYWKRAANQSVADAMQKGTARTLPFRQEPQGEAVCMDRNGRGFFTLSERGSAASTSLHYYAKK